MLVSQFDNMLHQIASERALAVLALAKASALLGYTIGRKADPEAHHMWKNIILIDLPTGQVSWHIHRDDWIHFEKFPIYPNRWDGHTKTERNDRLTSYGTK